MHPRSTIIALAIAASLLASGCCCPALSGRFNEVGCYPPHRQRYCPAPCPPVACQPADSICPPDVAACPPASIPSNAIVEDCPPECDACEGSCRRPFWRHHGCLSRWLTLGFGRGNVPSQKHPD